MNLTEHQVTLLVDTLTRVMRQLKVIGSAPIDPQTLYGIATDWLEYEQEQTLVSRYWKEACNFDWSSDRNKVKAYVIKRLSETMTEFRATSLVESWERNVT